MHQYGYSIIVCFDIKISYNLTFKDQNPLTFVYYRRIEENYQLSSHFILTYKGKVQRTMYSVAY